MKLRQKLFLAHVALFLIFATIFLSVVYFYSHSVFEKNAHESLEALASAKANHVETYLDQSIERLELVTSRNQLRSMLKSYNIEPADEKVENIHSIILAAQEPIEEFERICVVGLDGEIITSTNDDFVGVDVSDKDFFAEGLQESGVYFIDEENQVKMLVAGPFIYEDETIGVGITVVTLDTLSEIMAQYEGLGETGETYIAVFSDDEDPRVVTPRRETIGDPLDQTSPIIGTILIDEEVTGHHIDYRNQKVLAVTRKVGEYPVGLLAKIDEAEILAPIIGLFITFVLMTLGSLPIFMVVARIISGRITTPLEKLKNAAEEIGKGVFVWKKETKKDDEVDALAHSFEQLSKDVIRSKKDLETQVQERTKELQHTNEHLIGREERMAELKKENEQLKKQLGSSYEN